jgi:hypothetical protein
MKKQQQQQQQQQEKVANGLFSKETSMVLRYGA